MAAVLVTACSPPKRIQPTRQANVFRVFVCRSQVLGLWESPSGLLLCLLVRFGAASATFHKICRNHRAQTKSSEIGRPPSPAGDDPLPDTGRGRCVDLGSWAFWSLRRASCCACWFDSVLSYNNNKCWLTFCNKWPLFGDCVQSVAANTSNC